MYTEYQAGVIALLIWNNIKLIQKLSNTSSIFTAESYAILKCIQLVVDSNIPKERIFSDSLSAIINIKNVYNNYTSTKFVTTRKRKMIHYSVMPGPSSTTK